MLKMPVNARIEVNLINLVQESARKDEITPSKNVFMADIASYLKYLQYDYRHNFSL